MAHKGSDIDLKNVCKLVVLHDWQIVTAMTFMRKCECIRAKLSNKACKVNVDSLLKYKTVKI